VSTDSQSEQLDDLYECYLSLVERSERTLLKAAVRVGTPKKILCQPPLTRQQFDAAVARLEPDDRKKYAAFIRKPHSQRAAEFQQLIAELSNLFHFDADFRLSIGQE
jgi:hypothetical protein